MVDTCGMHSTIHREVESLSCTPETLVILCVNSTQIKKFKERIRLWAGIWIVNSRGQGRSTMTNQGVTMVPRWDDGDLGQGVVVQVVVGFWIHFEELPNGLEI